MILPKPMCVICYTDGPQSGLLRINWAEEIIELHEGKNQHYWARIVFHGQLDYSGSEKSYLHILHFGRVRDAVDISDTWCMWDGDRKKAGERKEGDSRYANRYNYFFLTGGTSSRRGSENDRIQRMVAPVPNTTDQVLFAREGSSSPQKISCSVLDKPTTQPESMPDTPVTRITIGPILASEGPHLFRVSFRTDDPVVPQGQSRSKRLTVFDQTQVLGEIRARFLQWKFERQKQGKQDIERELMFREWLDYASSSSVEIANYDSQVLIQANKVSDPSYGANYMSREPIFLDEFDPPLWSYAFMPKQLQNGEMEFRTAILIIEDK